MLAMFVLEFLSRHHTPSPWAVHRLRLNTLIFFCYTLMQCRYCHHFQDFTPHINQTEIDQSHKFSDVKSFVVCDRANNEITLCFGGRKFFISKMYETDVTVVASNGTFAV